MTDDVDFHLPPLVTKADLCEGDVSFIRNLRRDVPADVVVDQITAPSSTPAAPETDVLWFDVQPNGIRRVGANSGPSYTAENLLATVEMIADAIAEVNATWNESTGNVVQIDTNGATLGTEAEQFPKSPNGDPSLSEDAAVDMMQMGQAEAMRRSRTQPNYTHVFQLNSPDVHTAFEYRKLTTGDAGCISWETYSAHYGGSPRVSNNAMSLISLHERLGLPDVDANLDETALAYVDTDAMDYELVT